MGLLANWLQWHRSRAHMRAAFNRMGLEVNYNPLHITTYHNHAGAKYYVWGLYRVNFRDGNEVTARYQINGEDAFNTGTAMAQYEPWHRHELAVRPRGDGIVIPERFPPEIITFTLPGGSNAHDPAQAPVVTMTLGSPARRARQPRLDDRLPEERHAAA
jgi:hypothetical protein